MLSYVEIAAFNPELYVGRENMKSLLDWIFIPPIPMSIYFFLSYSNKSDSVRHNISIFERSNDKFDAIVWNNSISYPSIGDS